MAPPKHPLAKQRIAFQQQREQAQWRGESWQLAWEDWWQTWEPQWHLRGRCTGSICMTRLDPDLPWHKDNIQLVDRVEFMRWRAQQPRAPRGSRRKQ